MTLRRNRFADAGAAADALALSIAADLNDRLARQPRALLLVSGGRSPIPVFMALARQPLPWERIDVSLVDERSVALEHEDANARLVRQHLLTGAASAACWIALMPPDLFGRADNAFIAARAAAEQANVDPALAEPAVILLGMGNDGHTASLFADAPQWPEAKQTSRRYIALQPVAAPHARVSLTLQALRAQQRCYLWAMGADKAVTLARLEADGAARDNGAGPVACLLADPDVLLDAYCD